MRYDPCAPRFSRTCTRKECQISSKIFSNEAVMPFCHRVHLRRGLFYCTLDCLSNVNLWGEVNLIIVDDILLMTSWIRSCFMENLCVYVHERNWRMIFIRSSGILYGVFWSYSPPQFFSPVFFMIHLHLASSPQLRVLFHPLLFLNLNYVFLRISYLRTVFASFPSLSPPPAPPMYLLTFQSYGLF